MTPLSIRNIKITSLLGIISVTSLVLWQRFTGNEVHTLTDNPPGRFCMQDEQRKAFLRNLMDTGALQKISNTMYSNSSHLLTKNYPQLSLSNHSFRSLDGRHISTVDIVRKLQLVSPSRPIPNVVHFFKYAKTSKHKVELGFHEYLAFLGALWLSGADWLIVWCNVIPGGTYWQRFVRNLTAHGLQAKLLIADRPLPTSVFDRPVQVIQHQVDVMKLQTAILIGGVFLDSDSVTLRSLQPLRRHQCAIGREVSYGLSIGAFMSKPSASFVLIWYLMYQSFKDDYWGHHSVVVPYKIWDIFPKLCHVEEDTMVRPNWMEPELSMLYKDLAQLKVKWNWDKNYMVHLWSRKRPLMNETSALEFNSMYGQIARHILYGNKRLNNFTLPGPNKKTN